MEYTFSDGMKMTGYKVLHPTIQLAKTTYTFMQVLFSVLVLREAYMQSVPLGYAATIALAMVWIYKISWN
jgi:hypothetical protein